MLGCSVFNLLIDSLCLTGFIGEYKNVDFLDLLLILLVSFFIVMSCLFIWRRLFVFYFIWECFFLILSISIWVEFLLNELLISANLRLYLSNTNLTVLDNGFLWTVLVDCLLVGLFLVVYLLLNGLLLSSELAKFDL